MWFFVSAQAWDCAKVIVKHTEQIRQVWKLMRLTICVVRYPNQLKTYVLANVWKLHNSPHSYSWIITPQSAAISLGFEKVIFKSTHKLKFMFESVRLVLISLCSGFILSLSPPAIGVTFWEEEQLAMTPPCAYAGGRDLHARRGVGEGGCLPDKAIWGSIPGRLSVITIAIRAYLDGVEHIVKLLQGWSTINKYVCTCGCIIVAYY